MRRCLQLAKNGRENAKPNPMVGAVIVSGDGRIIGEGYHVRCGEGHAEVNASDLATNYQVLVSKDYTKDAGVAAASWTVLPLDLMQVSDWDTWTNTGNLNIPAEFCNTANVTIALRYIAQAKAATWEVKNFVLDQGAGDNGGGSGEEGGVKTLPYSEEFSTTLGGFKNYTAFTLVGDPAKPHWFRSPSTSATLHCVTVR